MSLLSSILFFYPKALPINIDITKRRTQGMEEVLQILGRTRIIAAETPQRLKEKVEEIN